MVTDTDNAQRQAKTQFESIAEMVKRLEHCEQCEDEECDLTSEEIYAGLGLYFDEGDTATEEQRIEYHERERAQEAIEEDALSVEVRSDWHTPGDREAEDGEYCILLCTGGPACRIIGDLGRYHEPDSARIEYQDWSTPWEEFRLTPAQKQIVIRYARCFWFGE